MKKVTYMQSLFLTYQAMSANTACVLIRQMSP